MSYQNFARNVNDRAGQVANSAGGYSYAVDPWQRLQRFLILGSDNGTYYIDAQTLTLENANAVIECLNTGDRRVVDMIVDVSVSGRAAKNSPTLFALALCLSPKYANEFIRDVAANSFNKVVRNASQLFEFVSYVTQFRGWGSQLTRLISNWYLSKQVNDLQYQIVKYQNRNGWTHRDLLRMAHPQTVSKSMNELFKWIVDDEADIDNAFIGAYKWAQMTEDVGTIVALINDYNLPMEAIPNKWYNDPHVRLALLQHTPMTNLIRNLGNLSAIGVLNNGTLGESLAINKLTDKASLLKARVHPMQLFIALSTYQAGRGLRSDKTWTVNRRICEALEAGFYATFDNVESSNKRILVAVDRSGSMLHSVTAGSNIPTATAAVAQALVLANTEPNADFVSFSTFVKDLPLTKNMSLFDARNRLVIEGGTDCSAPINYALNKKYIYDAFVILTDHETWANGSHPYRAFVNYRNAVNPDVKLVTVAMTSNGYQIGSPQDANVLDCIGFDTNTPSLISAFLTDQF